MKFENISVFNMDNAFRGMRNPLESWDKSDSYMDEGFFILGEKDIDLAQRLIKGGSEHRKFLRQIVVSVDITAPLYWWKEFDTYKVGTVANSTSTMHKLATTPITWDCFEWDDFQEDESTGEWISIMWEDLIEDLEEIRLMYVVSKNPFWWKTLIRLLPSSWLQTRTVTMNYENLLSMYGHRKRHKLTEWHQYCDWIKTLPYTQILFSLD